MTKTLANEVPYILTDEILSKEGLFTKCRTWNPQEVSEAMDSVERRYKARTSSEISDFVGLQLFCEIVKVLKEIPSPNSPQQDLILKAQKRVLHYHNIQYDRIKDNR